MFRLVLSIIEVVVAVVVVVILFILIAAKIAIIFTIICETKTCVITRRQREGMSPCYTAPLLCNQGHCSLFPENEFRCQKCRAMS